MTVPEEKTVVGRKKPFDGVLSGLREAIAEDLEPNMREIDVEGVYPEAFMRRMGAVGGFRQGTATELGGTGRGIGHTIRLMEEVSKTCLSTGFCVWCQTVCAWYVQNSDNAYLKENALPDIISGNVRAGTGLSNPMKHLSGIERIKISAARRPDGFVLNGAIPWVSNVDDGDQFFAAVAGVEGEGGYAMMVVPSGTEGVKKRNGGEFIALEGSSTWGWRFKDAFIPEEYVLADPASPYIQRIRPGFVLTQGGIGLGLVGGCLDLMRRANGRADTKKSGVNGFLDDGVEELEADLEAARRKTYALAEEIGCDGEDPRSGVFEEAIECRILASELSLRASRSTMLHMGATGYLKNGATERKLRESYFVAVVTPALKHLKKLRYDLQQAS